jgi:hypothetical protein
VLTYQSSQHYTDDLSFNCRGFLEDLHGKDFPVRVNCDDCASIVSAFSNILGCNLSQMYIEPVNAAEIGLKPIIRIGSNTWLEEDDFDHHEVASEGSCRQQDEVFDACVQVATVDEPTPTNRIPLQPTNLRFGLLGEEGYRCRLVTSDFQELCRPRPAGCTQRQLRAANRLGVPDEQQLKIQRQRHGFDNRSEDRSGRSGRFVLRFSLNPYILPGWRLIRLRKFDKGEIEEEEPQASQSRWRNTSNPNKVVRLDAFECVSSSEAQNGILTLLTRFEQRGMKPVELPKFGDLVFADERAETILFAINNLIFFVRNVGQDAIQLVEVAESLDRIVMEPFTKIVAPPVEVRWFYLENEESLLGNHVAIKCVSHEALLPTHIYHFFTNEGEVSRFKGELVYQSQALGINTLEIFAVDVSGNALKQVLRLNARPKLS